MSSSKKAAGHLILHIDDDPIQLRLVRSIVIREGYTSISAQDGATGLELARTRKPAVVILDVLMPDPDGYEVCRRLRAIPDLERLAIIMLTVTDDPELESNSFIAGADLTLRKPFKETKLLSMIDTALLLKGNRNNF